MTYTERQKFYRTNKWRKFKSSIRLQTSQDYITNEPLVSNWNLHHLDLDKSRYTDLSDKSHFMALNPKTHDFVHFIFKLYHKDKTIIDRLKKTLEKMEELTYKNIN